MRPAIDFRQEIINVIDEHSRIGVKTTDIPSCLVSVSVSESQTKECSPKKKRPSRNSKTVEQLRLERLLAEEKKKKRNKEYYKSIKEAAQAKKEISDLLRPKKNQTLAKETIQPNKIY